MNFDNINIQSNFDDKDVDIPVVSTPGSGCEPDEAPLAFLSVNPPKLNFNTLTARTIRGRYKKRV